MKHKSNNIKVFILILVLLAGLSLYAAASAETHSGSCGPNATWTLDDAGKLTISGSGEMTSKPWSNYREQVKTVEIKNGIISIYEFAFSKCSNLKSVTIPNSVKNIEGYAFNECTGLQSLTIPASVTQFGSSVFYNCRNLKTVSFQSNIKNPDFYSLFLGCSQLTAVNIPSSNPTYSSQGGIIFDKSGKTLLFCPNGIKGTYSIPAGVTKIGNNAFLTCCNLTSISIPGSVTAIGEDAFMHCLNLKSITIPSGVTSIGGGAFQSCIQLQSVTVSEGVKKIPEYCFFGCNRLMKLTLPHTLESIGKEAFADCPVLQVTLYGNIKSIGSHAFQNTIVLYAPEGSYVAQWARDNNYILEIIEPEYVVTFQYANNQGSASASPAYGKKGTKVTLKASPKKGFLFSGWSVVSGGVKIENNQFKIGTSDVVIKAKFKKDPSYASVKGAEYKLNTKKKTASYLNPTSKSKTSITIPATINVDGVKYQVTEIASNAFKGCSRLKKVTIGKNIVKIGKNAFKGCKSLATITIKTTKLTKKGIGSNCFKSIAAKPTFKCPKKQKNDYKTWIVKTGKAPKKSKFK